MEIGIAGIQVRAAQVTAPMLVIGGNDDRLTPPALVRRIAGKYNADLRLYDNHAHYLMRELGWTVVADEIMAWLDQCSRARQQGNHK